MTNPEILDFLEWDDKKIKKVNYNDLIDVRDFILNRAVSKGKFIKSLSLINSEITRRKNDWDKNERDISRGTANWKYELKAGRLKPNSDYGKYRSPIKESNMTTLDRLERMIMKEEITDQKVEAPIQSTGSTPESSKSGSSLPPMKSEPSMGSEPQKPESNQPHTDFMEAVKPTMEKVKANQIVTWEELKRLADMFDKIVK